MNNQKLVEVIEHFGGVPGLAKALGCERQAVYQWRGKIPKLRAYQVEAITKGRFKASDLLKDDAA